MDAREYKKRVDELLAERGLVDREFFCKLVEAYGYQAVSTVGWVEAKLRVLQDRLTQGKSLSRYEPRNDSQIVVADDGAFVTWVCKHFPGLRSIGKHRDPDRH